MKHLKHKVTKRFVRRMVSLMLMLAMVLCTVSVMTSAEDEEVAGGIEMVDAVFATTTITEGTRFTTSNIEVRQVPAYNAPTNIINTIEEVQGKFALGTVYEGDYIYADKMSAKKPSETEGPAKVELSKEKFLDISAYIQKGTKKDVSDKIGKKIK